MHAISKCLGIPFESPFQQQISPAGAPPSSTVAIQLRIPRWASTQFSPPQLEPTTLCHDGARIASRCKATAASGARSLLLHPSPRAHIFEHFFKLKFIGSRQSAALVLRGVCLPSAQYTLAPTQALQTSGQKRKRTGVMFSEEPDEPLHLLR